MCRVVESIGVEFQHSARTGANEVVVESLWRHQAATPLNVTTVVSAEEVTDLVRQDEGISILALRMVGHRDVLPADVRIPILGGCALLGRQNDHDVCSFERNRLPGGLPDVANCHRTFG